MRKTRSKYSNTERFSCSCSIMCLFNAICNTVVCVFSNNYKINCMIYYMYKTCTLSLSVPLIEIILKFIICLFGLLLYENEQTMTI